MRDLPSCPRCHDNDWTVPAELQEPCYIRFDADDTADFADGPGPRVYLRHADAQFNLSGQVFCTSCGWEPTPTDTKSVHVNEPLMRQRLVEATLDYEGTWPTSTTTRTARRGRAATAGPDPPAALTRPTSAWQARPSRHSPNHP
jgi:hypothetical protein